ncbi:MAG: hypothetical protein Kow00124_22920 [Anaerolineae bacterium]
MLRLGQPEIRASTPRTFYEDLPAVWRASTLTFGVILLLVAGLAVGHLIIGEPQGTTRLLVSITAAAAPPLLWAAFLYQIAARQQTAVAPLVLTLFMLGALIAAAVTRPVLLDLLDLDTWLSSTTVIRRLLSNILIGGFWHAFLLYAMVRYTVWRTEVFTRRTDGVLFSMAASWGYALAINLLFVLDQDGLTMLNGNLRLLAQQAAFLVPGVVLGYFLGRSRFEVMPAYYLTLGLVIAAGLNGLLLFAGTELNSIRLGFDQDGFSPWPGLVVSLLAMGLTFFAIYGIIRRDNALTRARLEQG